MSGRSMAVREAAGLIARALLVRSKTLRGDAAQLLVGAAVDLVDLDALWVREDVDILARALAASAGVGWTESDPATRARCRLLAHLTCRAFLSQSDSLDPFDPLDRDRRVLEALASAARQVTTRPGRIAARLCEGGR